MLLIKQEFVEQEKVETLPIGNQSNPFEIAANGDVAALNATLAECDLNAVDQNGMSMLHHAALALRADNVERLLQERVNGLDIHIEDHSGRSVLFAVELRHGFTNDPRVIQINDLITASLLQEELENPNPEDAELYADDASMSLFEAARSPDIKWLNQALEEHDVNEVDQGGLSALHHAAYGLAFAQVDRLFEEIPNGFDPTVQDDQGRDAIDYIQSVYQPDDTPRHIMQAVQRMVEKLEPIVRPESQIQLSMTDNAGPGDEFPGP